MNRRSSIHQLFNRVCPGNCTTIACVSEGHGVDTIYHTSNNDIAHALERQWAKVLSTSPSTCTLFLIGCILTCPPFPTTTGLLLRIMCQTPFALLRIILRGLMASRMEHTSIVLSPTPSSFVVLRSCPSLHPVCFRMASIMLSFVV